VDPDRIGVYGRSFGGRVAMIMGNESWGGIDYKAMALIAPAGNEYALIHYVGGQEEWDRINTILTKAIAAVYPEIEVIPYKNQRREHQKQRRTCNRSTSSNINRHQ
jgi:dienelactone hydrolase